MLNLKVIMQMLLNLVEQGVIKRLLMYHQMNGQCNLTGTQWPSMKIMRTVYLIKVSQILVNTLYINASRYCDQCVVQGIFE